MGPAAELESHVRGCVSDGPASSAPFPGSSKARRSRGGRGRAEGPEVPAGLRGRRRLRRRVRVRPPMGIELQSLVACPTPLPALSPSGTDWERVSEEVGAPPASSAPRPEERGRGEAAGAGVGREGPEVPAGLRGRRRLRRRVRVRPSMGLELPSSLSMSDREMVSEGDGPGKENGDAEAVASGPDGL